MDVILKSPKEISLEIACRAKRLRLDLNITQTDLAARSGISLSSIKRFENSGQIALSSLLQIALILDRLLDFNSFFSPSPIHPSLFRPKPKKRLRAGKKRPKE